MLSNFNPIGDKVLVKPDSKEEQRPSGLFVTDMHNLDKQTRGTILAVGPGRRLEDGTRVPVAVSVGDRVLYAKYAGTELKLENEDYLLIREEELLATF